MRKSTLAVAALAVALGLPTLACGDTGAESTSSSGGTPAAAGKSPKAVTTVKVGEKLTVTETVLGEKTIVELTLSAVKTGGKGTQFDKPSKGQYITATVAALVKEGKTTVNSSQFKLVAKDGTAYDTTVVLDGDDLSAMDLAAGQKTSGLIRFDVPKGAEKGAKIAVLSFLADGDVGYWALP